MIVTWEVMIILISVSTMVFGHFIIKWFDVGDESSCSTENIKSTVSSGALDLQEFVTAGTIFYDGISNVLVF